MPYRYLNLDEAAQHLHLDRADLESLVKDQEIPFEKRGGRIVFSRPDLDAWASQRILGASASRLAEFHKKTSQDSQGLLASDALLPELIRPEQIDPAMKAKTKASVLRDMVALAGRTGLVYDPPELIASLEAREELCSTAVPGGVAFLHPRAQQPYRFAASFLVLGRTVQPIHYGSPDRQPTDLFFLLGCQDDRLHLHILARLCLIAVKTDLLARLRGAADANAMCECLLESEQEVTAAARTKG
jgi:nitrogen PTS system EIIA component